MHALVPAEILLRVAGLDASPMHAVCNPGAGRQRPIPDRSVTRRAHRARRAAGHVIAVSKFMIFIDLVGHAGPYRIAAVAAQRRLRYLYWLVFLLALEPGNVLHARHMGHTLDFDSEAARIWWLRCSALPSRLYWSR